MDGSSPSLPKNGELTFFVMFLLHYLHVNLHELIQVHGQHGQTLSDCAL